MGSSPPARSNSAKRARSWSRYSLASEMTSRAHIDRTGSTAPGKVILLGEHAVVYGRTALAAAIDRHVTVRIHHPCDSRKSALREPQRERNKNHFEFEIEHPLVLRPSKHAAAGYDH